MTQLGRPCRSCAPTASSSLNEPLIYSPWLRIPKAAGTGCEQPRAQPSPAWPGARSASGPSRSQVPSLRALAAPAAAPGPGLAPLSSPSPFRQENAARCILRRDFKAGSLPALTPRGRCLRPAPLFSRSQGPVGASWRQPTGALGMGPLRREGPSPQALSSPGRWSSPLGGAGAARVTGAGWNGPHPQGASRAGHEAAKLRRSRTLVQSRACCRLPPPQAAPPCSAFGPPGPG